MTITIRRATPDDAAAFARVMGDEGVYPGTLQLPYTSEALWKTRLATAGDPARPDLLLAGELDGNVVATAGLHPVGPQARRRHAVMLGLGVVPEAQGRGVGRALMQAMCDYADRWAGVLRIELTVYADNARAVALYRHFGFAIEGRHRGFALRDGVLIDAYAMARIHPNPPQVAPYDAAAIGRDPFA